MPTSNPRVNVTFSESDAEMMHSICQEKKLSMSALIRKVMTDWLEEHEDTVLARRADEAHERWENSGRRTLSHEALWKRLDI